ADDHRLVGEVRPVALLDAGVESIAVDMGEEQVVEIVMGDQPGRVAAAAAAAGIAAGRQRQAVAAEPAHPRSLPIAAGGHSQAAPRTPLESPCRGGTMRT